MNWFRIKSFLKYYFRAITVFNTHSPFIYDFITHVLDTDKHYYSFDQIEARRKILLVSKNEIDIIDYGAGSKVVKSGSKRTVAQIAKSSLSSGNKCRTLFNLVLHYKCINILELGTSLGISSSYLASASKNAKVYTIEGDEKVASLAAATHQSLGLTNIDLFIGSFDSRLTQAMEEVNTFDFIFIDGHHRGDATVRYFESLLQKCDEDTIIVIDDIHWSKDMSEAWEKIKNRSDVTLTIDLFDIGVVFFRPQLNKENITYISYHYKPWRIGLFG